MITLQKAFLWITTIVIFLSAGLIEAKSEFDVGVNEHDYYALLSCYPEGVRWVCDDRYIIYEDDRKTLVDSSGHKLSKQYDAIFECASGVMCVCNDDAGFNFIDLNGNEICDYYVEECDLQFRDHVAMVKIGNKRGLINNCGQLIVPAAFEELYCYNSICCIGTNSLDEVLVYNIDLGKYIPVPQEFYVMKDTLSEDVFILGRRYPDGREAFYYMLASGSINDAEYIDAVPFQDGIAVARDLKGDLYLLRKTVCGIERSAFDGTILDNSCERYYPLKGFQYGYFIKRGSNSLVGAINLASEIVIPFRYDHVHSYGNGYFRVEQDKKYSIACQDCENECLHFDYLGEKIDWLHQYTLGLLYETDDTETTQKWYYVDLNGKIIKQCITFSDLDRSLIDEYLPGLAF